MKKRDKSVKRLKPARHDRTGKRLKYEAKQPQLVLSVYFDISTTLAGTLSCLPNYSENEFSVFHSI